MRNKLFLFLGALFLFPALSRAEDVVSQISVTLKSPTDGYTVKVNSLVVSESGAAAATPVASFTDTKGNKISITSSSKYVAATKTMKTDIEIAKTLATGGAAQKVAAATIGCVLPDEASACRDVAEVEGQLTIEVEDALAPAATPSDSAKAVSVNLVSVKKLNNSRSGKEKMLEKYQGSGAYELGAAASEIYSDSKTGKALSAKFTKDAKNNVLGTYSGKDGEVTLAGRSGLGSNFSLVAPTPAPNVQFNREISTEIVLQDAPVPEGAASKATLTGIIDSPLGTEEPQRVSVNSAMSLDASGLQPDAKQDGYESKDALGLLVDEVAFTTEANESKSLKTYWDLSPAAKTDTTQSITRTNVYNFVTTDANSKPNKERTIKVRSNSGQRSRVEFSESPDFNKADTAAVEAEFQLN